MTTAASSILITSTGTATSAFSCNATGSAGGGAATGVAAGAGDWKGAVDGDDPSLESEWSLWLTAAGEAAAGGSSWRGGAAASTAAHGAGEGSGSETDFGWSSGAGRVDCCWQGPSVERE